jgi:hypothetical protein
LTGIGTVQAPTGAAAALADARGSDDVHHLAMETCSSRSRST